MSHFSASMIREFLLDFVAERLMLRGYSAAQISDDFDLLASGAIDSLAFMEMIVALQEQFDVELDFDEVDPEQLSVIGPLCHYVGSLKLKGLSTEKM
ncbi:MAG TPA: acyl carrier protein [Geobacteraceae bacterium]|nr:acyl carrier protein [Geobacteraceae bacterium]